MAGAQLPTYYNEEGFLPRLADLGRVRVAWRSHGLSPDDTCPREAADGEAARRRGAWRARHSMTCTWAVGVLARSGYGYGESEGPGLLRPSSVES